MERAGSRFSGSGATSRRIVMRMCHLGAVILAMSVGVGLGSAVSAAPQGASAPAASGQGVRSTTDQGAEMFRGYCGPCHGAKGHGDGPVAASLKSKPTDLTKLAAGNNGQFPAQRVAMVLEFGVPVPAHGSTDMPTWGSTFRVMGDETTVRQRVTALTRYLETIQAK
jgi:mono/diheme cytochrome c family protein